MNEAFPPEILKKLTETFTDAGSTNINALQQIRDVQVMMGSLLQHEAKRLEKKLGTDNLRVQQFQASIKRNQTIAKDLEVELEIAKIRVPEVDPKDSLIHGRIVDKNRRGLAGLVVSIADVRGNAIRAFGKTTTDVSGYYALPVKAEVLQKVTASIKEGVVVVVSNANEELIYRNHNPVRLVASDRILVESVINRSDISSPGGGKQPSEKPPTDDQTPAPQEAWVVRGRVTDETGKGIAGLMVSALDRDRRYDDKLGSALTNREGEFRITYRVQDFREGLERGPDLYVTIIDIEGNLLHSSIDSIRENAKREEVYEIRLNRSDRG
ncbi:MAG: carboxypeptidase-like regulatory domain-containing protein [Oscillatoriaceae cyanobacterium Prado104]|jgi:protocatechuate 3,4-dioxygenase beta subunit|nr:carboxypeptidase-like regulatory domain-containing protein [Oscillatoriaceae cyanobacterium Prado104]